MRDVSWICRGPMRALAAADVGGGRETYGRPLAAPLPLGASAHRLGPPGQRWLSVLSPAGSQLRLSCILGAENAHASAVLTPVRPQSSRPCVRRHGGQHSKLLRDITAALLR